MDHNLGQREGFEVRTRGSTASRSRMRIEVIVPFKQVHGVQYICVLSNYDRSFDPERSELRGGRLRGGAGNRW